MNKFLNARDFDNAVDIKDADDVENAIDIASNYVLLSGSTKPEEQDTDTQTTTVPEKETTSPVTEKLQPEQQQQGEQKIAITVETDNHEVNNSDTKKTKKQTNKQKQDQAEGKKREKQNHQNNKTNKAKDASGTLTPTSQQQQQVKQTPNQNEQTHKRNGVVQNLSAKQELTKRAIKTSSTKTPNENRKVQSKQQKKKKQHAPTKNKDTDEFDDTVRFIFLHEIHFFFLLFTFHKPFTFNNFKHLDFRIGHKPYFHHGRRAHKFKTSNQDCSDNSICSAFLIVPKIVEQRRAHRGRRSI